MVPTGSTIVKGAFWTISARFSVRILGLVSTAVLARLLMPEDFGAVALVMSITAILQIFFDVGVEDYLIYKKDATDQDYNTAWTLRIVTGLLVAFFLAAGAPFIAAFIERPDLVALFYAVAGLFCFTPFRNIGLVAFRKNIQFQQDFSVQIYPKIFAFLVTIIAAFVLKNYWALIIGQYARLMAAWVMSYVMSSFRPRFSLANWRDMIRFSGWLTVSNALFAVSARIDDIVLIKLADARAVGIFSIAKEIAALPTSELIAPINRVLFPSFSKAQSALEEMRRMALNAISTLSALAMPAGIGICLVAPLLVRVMLGENWGEAVFPIQIISVLIVIQMITINMPAVAMALGKTQILFNRSLVYSLIRPGIFIFGALQAGFMGALVGYVIAGTFLGVMDLFILSRLLKLPVHRIVGAQARTLVALAVMSLGCILLQAQLPPAPDFVPALLQLILVSLFGALLYAGSLLLLWQLTGRPTGAESRLLSMAGQGLRKARARLTA